MFSTSGPCGSEISRPSIVNVDISLNKEHVNKLCSLVLNAIHHSGPRAREKLGRTILTQVAAIEKSMRSSGKTRVVSSKLGESPSAVNTQKASLVINEKNWRHLN